MGKRRTDHFESDTSSNGNYRERGGSWPPRGIKDEIDEMEGDWLMLVSNPGQLRGWMLCCSSAIGSMGRPFGFVSVVVDATSHHG